MLSSKRITAGIMCAAAVVAVGACSKNNASTANRSEQDTQAQIQTGMLAKQPIPVFDYSQYRQTLTTVENAEAHGVATTSFFYNMGVKDPIFVCPSLGFPVASTSSLTNPHQVIYTNHPNGGNDANVVDQMEPNGVYPGPSNGTYVECVSPEGTQYAKYWEGDVDTIGGPAHWDRTQGQEVLDGAPTVLTKK